jgi:hypothetical protein
MANESEEEDVQGKRRLNGQHASRRSRRAPREPEVNAIRATRRPRKSQVSANAAPATVDEAPKPPEGASSGTPPSQHSAAVIPQSDSDPWTVPQSVRDRFVQDGHRFYFPDGAAAFKDLGRKLTTPSENTQVVHSLVEIAHSRGWTEVTVTGTERFRQEAWRQARMAGLSVRGYKPSDIEQAQLIRTLARNLTHSAERGDSVSSEVAAAPLRPETAVQVSAEPVKLPAPPQERIAGKLLEHGRDAYRHDPNEDPSYFVRVQTRDGSRELWGKDIERALVKSLTQPQVGDEVILQRNGRDAVTVQRRERDAAGALKERPVVAHRNRWVIEKRGFFEERAAAARIVRDATIGARDAVGQHPELAGTYLNLRAAELAAKALRDPQDQRRFVMQVRGALADDIERGQPLQPVRLRERARRATESPQPAGRSVDGRINAPERV